MTEDLTERSGQNAGTQRARGGPSFTMQALVLQTSLPADTLRAWERRYGFPAPARTSGGHRLYTADDVEAIRWVLQKQHEGVRAKQAIEMWRHHTGGGSAPLAAGADRLPALETLDALRAEWHAACLNLDAERALQAFNRAGAMLGPERTLIDVVTPGLAQIGRQWDAGTASVAQEHFASALAMRHVLSLTQAEAPALRPEKLLLATPDGEYHAYVPALLAFLLRRYGWKAIFLNASLPLADLTSTLNREHAALVISAAQSVPAADALLSEAQALQSAGVPFAFGGSVFVRHPELVARIAGHYLGADLAAVPALVERILRGELAANRPAPIGVEWEQWARALPDALMQVQLTLLGQPQPPGLSREAAEKALGLWRVYVLSTVRLAAPGLLPSAWTWVAQMLRESRLHVIDWQLLRARMHALLDASPLPELRRLTALL
jgi:DNA-binding transcriptional MerR regulator